MTTQTQKEDRLAFDRNLAEFHYNGFCLWHEEDVEEDNIKLWHCVITPSGDRVYVDWSPYQRMTNDDFVTWVRLGMPDRYALQWCVSPLRREDLQHLKDRQ